MRHDGTLDNLKKVVSECGLGGKWEEKHNNGPVHQFRARSGEVVNWAAATGTIWLQGQNQEHLASLLQDRLDALYGDEIQDRDQSPRIFIVHGHDEISRNQLELALRRMNLDPFILQDRNNDGLTIIEALQQQIYTEASFGIILMTPDDFGYSKADGEAGRQPRARQNVILEMGMVMAALGRSRTLILKKGALEAPSDAGGIMYAAFNDHIREIVPNLVQRLRASGFQITADQMAAAQK